MQENNFAEFVARQHASNNLPQADLSQIRDEWLANLNALYAQIRNYLELYISSSQITVSYETLDINEENLGYYAAQQMNLDIGRQRVSLVPKGTLLIACKGRVDVVGSIGQASLLLLDDRSKRLYDQARVTVTVYDSTTRPSATLPNEQNNVMWTWKILSNTPLRDLAELNQASLLQLILEVANG